MVNSNNYISIQGWMINDLQLKGNDLLVYAIIYGFSQDNNTSFKGSLQYLADWCSATKQGIQKNLKNLLDRGLITKTEVIRNGVKYCEYSCIPYNSVAYPIQLSCTNNIEDTQDNKSNISKDILDKEEFLGSVTKKTKGKSLYQKCIDIINDYTDDEHIRNLLMQYLKLRLEMSDSQMYANQWKGMLNKLSTLDGDKSEIIQQSIDRGYRSFFPVNSYSNKKDIFSECGEVHSYSKERKEINKSNGAY